MAIVKLLAASGFLESIFELLQYAVVISDHVLIQIFYPVLQGSHFHLAKTYAFDLKLPLLQKQ